MRRTPLITALIALVAFAAALAPAAMAKGSGTTRTIALHGSVSFPNASGKAVSKVNGIERELQIEVEDINALAGKHVNVFVNGNKLASPLVNSFGVVRVNRNTDKGQFVPTIHTGSTVVVRTLGGTLIASGTF
jgi:predicted PilT family ATPase